MMMMMTMTFQTQKTKGYHSGSKGIEAPTQKSEAKPCVEKAILACTYDYYDYYCAKRGRKTKPLLGSSHHQTVVVIASTHTFHFLVNRLIISLILGFN